MRLLAVEPFELRIPHDMLLTSRVHVWWQDTPEQRFRYNLESKKAFGFVVGMIPPIVVLLYIAFYLSCFRNSVNQDANMFGSENL